jgi:hypothetical protein
MTTCDILNKINKYIKLKKKLLIFCFKKIKKEKRKKNEKRKKKKMDGGSFEGGLHATYNTYGWLEPPPSEVRTTRRPPLDQVGPPPTHRGEATHHSWPPFGGCHAAIHFFFFLFFYFFHFFI